MLSPVQFVVLCLKVLVIVSYIVRAFYGLLTMDNGFMSCAEVFVMLLMKLNCTNWRDWQKVTFSAKNMF